jgi:hypothetical protein
MIRKSGYRFCEKIMLTQWTKAAFTPEAWEPLSGVSSEDRYQLGSFPDCLAIWVAIASISGGDRQS